MFPTEMLKYPCTGMYGTCAHVSTCTYMCVYMCTCAKHMYTCAKNVIFREPGNHFLHFPGTGKSFSGNFFQFLSCTGVFQYTDTCTTHVQHMCNISSTGCTKTISNKHHCTWAVQYINACATHVQHMCKILLQTVIQQHFHLLYAIVSN